ncbi:ABC transporter permease [Flexivirga meconopsidis]|uniref:ABC transporter permease n=1 Tax=Flexivirga meconopsidis TaxID=2977121 RepID=UPI0022409658|nr:ABC transporter permease [Flexivirga meconopsidis]
MILSKGARRAFAAITGVILLLMYIPLMLVVVNSFNTSQAFEWPPPGFTGEWWSRAIHNDGAREALWTSVQVGIVATVVAALLGTLLALALSRYQFFGRTGVNLLVVLPIALPGIITGIALNNAFRGILDLRLSILTVTIAHSTFCIVTVFNNVAARLRQVGGNLEEASADLGAGVWTTFRLVTFPQLRTALVAGMLLSFALSFDEIVVTTFTAGAGQDTLPLWIFNNMFRPNQAPIVNVVAVVMILISIIPIWLAQRLSDDVTAAAP